MNKTKSIQGVVMLAVFLVATLYLFRFYPQQIIPSYGKAQYTLTEETLKVCADSSGVRLNAVYPESDVRLDYGIDSDENLSSWVLQDNEMHISGEGISQKVTNIRLQKYVLPSHKWYVIVHVDARKWEGHTENPQLIFSGCVQFAKPMQLPDETVDTDTSQVNESDTCIEGDTKTIQCDDGSVIIISECINGKWMNIEATCSTGGAVQSKIPLWIIITLIIMILIFTILLFIVRRGV